MITLRTSTLHPKCHRHISPMGVLFQNSTGPAVKIVKHVYLRERVVLYDNMKVRLGMTQDAHCMERVVICIRTVTMHSGTKVLLSALWREDRRWEPNMDAATRDRLTAGWDKAVARTLGWVTETP